ncbi:MAG: chromosome segregation protein SMC [Gammaproteobacteria bacterium]|nr:chromosome segregation protein SMC [Gammaproteobacteria bacterium]
MRLKNIHVSGFKSFVDPTTFKVRANIVGIVGPNGCGKSNVIDALRWVMGEASAKNLRGDSMADVIFNGSTARKPVGKAAVELTFDNTGRRGPDAYSQFTEISVKRTLSRDGTSEYFVNGARCRRRDITDIFRGTGLGPRSYSIIEQGMVSRIVEARPDDLRLFVEEAAGISKYKDRRRETETRIRHTRENLERVNDIRSELETQLRRLKRQSQAAQRYKVLKEEERLVQAQLLALRWKTLHDNLSNHEQQLSHLKTELEGRIAAQRETETQIEQQRSQQTEAQEKMNTVQGEFYRISADVATVEQNIEHAHETHKRQQAEHERLVQEVTSLQYQSDKDKDALRVAQNEIEQINPKFERLTQTMNAANEALAQSEEKNRDWENRWEQFNREAIEPAQQQVRHSAKVEQIQQQIAQLNQRLGNLRNEREHLEQQMASDNPPATKQKVARFDVEFDQKQKQLEELEGKVRRLRELSDHAAQQVDDQRGELQQISARSQSLQEIQDAAMHEDDDDYRQWLQRQGITNAPRLTTRLSVQAGWEQAVDAILGDRLAGFCVASLDRVSTNELDSTDRGITLIQSGDSQQSHAQENSLLAKVSGQDVNVRSLLSDVQVAEDTTEAMRRRDQLKDGECIVTRGGVLVGRNWLHRPQKNEQQSNILERAKTIDELGQQAKQLKSALDELLADQVSRQHELQEQETVLDAARTAHREMAKQRAELHSQLGAQEARHKEMTSRQNQLRDEMDSVNSEIDSCHAGLSGAEQFLAQAEMVSGSREQQTNELVAERDSIRVRLNELRDAASQAQEDRHSVALEHHRLEVTIQSAQEQVERLTHQIQEVSQRRDELHGILSQSDDPAAELTQQLEKLLAQRVSSEDLLRKTREEFSQQEETLRSLSEKRSAREQDVSVAREKVEQQGLVRQELVVRSQNVSEQIQNAGYQVETLVRELPEGAHEDVWEEKFENVTKRIERIGPVNLVAIEEFDEQSERKDYLDKQHEDLIQALTTLEGVIRKIDKDTRQRFKDTFEQLDQNFREFFPKLFGGGIATLQLTDDDMLSAGVTVMARPPGKRNSTIHLLSGGEKALTAVSLIFSFFKLNPAPFCLLDEVDAPLDDANVVRYCETLKSLAEHTQLMFITHNKITMEFADILVGVTMGEPGVSRLVSVDIEQALEMAVQ